MSRAPVARCTIIYEALRTLEHNKIAITNWTNKWIWCLDAASVMCPAAKSKLTQTTMYTHVPREIDIYIIWEINSQQKKLFSFHSSSIVRGREKVTGINQENYRFFCYYVYHKIISLYCPWIKLQSYYKDIIKIIEYNVFTFRTRKKKENTW